MDRLSIILTLMTGSVLTGSLVIAVLALGWYSWVAIGTAAAVGFVLAWPAAYAISRYIKRRDARFHPPPAPRDGVLPDPNAPEV